jgi:ribonuclease Z
VRALEHRTAASLFVPHSAGQALRELLRTFAAFAGSTFEYRVFDLHEGAAVPLKNGITVTPFATDHVIQTFGFLVEESVTKLRPECADLPQKQIAAARREGRSDVFYTEVRPILAYVPDTLPSVLDRLPDNAWKARILMIESSFLDDRKPLAKIRLGNHVRVDDVAQRVHRFQGENIVLFHFSRMYGRDEIPDLVAAAFPEPFKHRVHCFLPSEGFPL